METLNKNRKIIGAVVIVVLAFFLYKFLAGSQAAPLPDAPGLSATEANVDLLKMAQDISAVNYQSDLFSTPGYRQLVDFSAPLAPQAIGRANPFDIIGRE